MKKFLKTEKVNSIANKVKNVFTSSTKRGFSSLSMRVTNMDNNLPVQQEIISNSGIFSQSGVVYNLQKANSNINIKIAEPKGNLSKSLDQEVISEKFAKSSAMLVENNVEESLDIINIEEDKDNHEPKEVINFTNKSNLFKTWKKGAENSFQQGFPNQLPNNIIVEETVINPLKHSNYGPINNNFNFSHVRNNTPQTLPGVNLSMLFPKESLQLDRIDEKASFSASASGFKEESKFPKLDQVGETVKFYCDKKLFNTSDKLLSHIEKLAMQFLQERKDIDAIEVNIPKLNEKLVVYKDVISKEQNRVLKVDLFEKKELDFNKQSSLSNNTENQLARVDMGSSDSSGSGDSSDSSSWQANIFNQFELLSPFVSDDGKINTVTVDIGRTALLFIQNQLFNIFQFKEKRAPQNKKAIALPNTSQQIKPSKEGDNNNEEERREQYNSAHHPLVKSLSVSDNEEKIPEKKSDSYKPNPSYELAITIPEIGSEEEGRKNKKEKTLVVLPASEETSIVNQNTANNSKIKSSFTTRFNDGIEKSDEECGNLDNPLALLGNTNRERFCVAGSAIVFGYASFKSAVFLGGAALSAGKGVYGMASGVISIASFVCGNMLQIVGQMVAGKEYMY